MTCRGLLDGERGMRPCVVMRGVSESSRRTERVKPAGRPVSTTCAAEASRRIDVPNGTDRATPSDGDGVSPMDEEGDDDGDGGDDGDEEEGLDQTDETGGFMARGNLGRTFCLRLCTAACAAEYAA